MEGPDSSYSCLEIHICWKVEREARVEPPIQTEYFLSRGAMILILMMERARAVISFSGHDGVGVQVLPDVNVALHDGVVGGLVDAAGLHSQEAGLEEGLGHLNLLEVEGDVAQLLLDLTDNLPLSDGGEGVAPLGEDLHQAVGELTASQVKTDDGV